MQLTPHFSLEELTRSTTALRKGIDNSAPPAVQAALKLLCVHVLEPVRAHFGKPVIVTSGYRAPKLNKLIGGSTTSRHCFGEAADFTVQGVSNLEVCQYIAAHLQFDQLIYEFGPSGWVHVGYCTPGRNEVLSARKVNGRTRYLNGLVY